MRKTHMYKLFSHIKDVDLLSDDKPCSGHPTTARIDTNIEKTHIVMFSDP